MSSRSSVSSNAPPKLPAQVISTPRTPRVYTQRKLSSARRVRDMRNLPEYDSRGLLADPLKAYSQPDALYEEKVKLTQEVDSLLAEVIPLREQAELISKQFEEPDRDPLEEVGEINLKQKIEKYQNEIELINKSLSRFAEVFTKKNEEELKAQIQLDRREKSALEPEIEALQNQLYDTADQVDVMNNSPSIDIVQDNNERIAELQKTLDELKQEEADLLALHEKLLKTEPTDAAKSLQLGPYLKQLQQLQHIRTKRSVEFKKAQRNYNSQVQFMEAVKADKLKKDRERKRREAWNKSYKNREAVNEENRRKLEENQNNTKNTLYSFYEEEEKVEYETIRRITVHRHKHKRYHHKEKDPNPLMFKTEVEKTETLHITQPQKQDDTNNYGPHEDEEQYNINDDPNIMIDLQGNNNDEQNINNDEQIINNDEQSINNEQGINNDEHNNNEEEEINVDVQGNNAEQNNINNEEEEINAGEQGNNAEQNNNNNEEEINVGEQGNNDEQNNIADEQGNIGDEQNNNNEEQNDNNEEQNNNEDQEINADEQGNINDEQEINNGEQNNNDEQGNNGDEQDNNNGEQNNENGEQKA